MSSVLPPVEPTPRRRVNGALVVIGLVAVLVAALAVFLLVRGKQADPGTDEKPIDAVKGAVPISMSDGVKLGAQVTRPTGAGKHPLVIMPSSYGATSAQYAAVAGQLTAAGFVTVSYTQRGFQNSQGTIDLAGLRTQRDARAVIDWSLQHTAADPQRIGMLGVSYGAGISLLTAAHDKRVRAVVALSSWADMAGAFHPHDTTSVLGLGGLLSNERVSPDLKKVANTLRSNPFANADTFTSITPVRSADTYVDDINANKPAIMLASGWQDSLLAPVQLLPFYEKLTTPKRLQLSIGDHGGPEYDMLSGAQSRTGDAAYAWLAHYLAGKNNGIDRQRPVQLEDVTAKTVQAFRSWPDASRVEQSLAAPATDRVGITSQPSTWSAKVAVSGPTDDTSAKAGLSQFTPSQKYLLPTARPSDIPTDKGFVWSAGDVQQPTRVLGSPKFSVSMASSSPQATLFVYLYDVAPDGTGSLMTLTPYTATGLSDGSPKPVSFDLDPIDWTLAAGHRLSVVIDTVEPRWWQAAPAGSLLELSSSAASPAGISIPVG